MLTAFKTELQAIAVPPLFVLHADAGELRRGAAAQRLPAVRAATRSSPASARPPRPGDRRAGGVLDGVLPHQAHARHPDVDAVDQDDAGGRRAGADLRAGADRRAARLADRADHRVHAVEPADHGVDAVFAASRTSRTRSSKPRAWTAPACGASSATCCCRWRWAGSHPPACCAWC